MTYLVVGHHEGHQLTDVRFSLEDSVQWWVSVTELDSVYFDYSRRRCFLRHAPGPQDSTGMPFLLFEAGDSTAALTIDDITVCGPFRWDTL
jgi:hypothetical protein